MTDTALTICHEIATILNGTYRVATQLNADFTVEPEKLADILRRFINEEVDERVKIREASITAEGARIGSKLANEELSRIRTSTIIWLGQWRDHLPAKAVRQLQDIAAHGQGISGQPLTSDIERMDDKIMRLEEALKLVMVALDDPCSVEPIDVAGAYKIAEDALNASF